MVESKLLSVRRNNTCFFSLIAIMLPWMIAMMTTTAQLHAQWQNQCQLTESSGDSWTNDFGYQGLIVDGDVIHAVYEDDTQGDYGVFYRRSEDAGASWLPAVHVSAMAGNNTFPTIAGSGDVLHLAWVNEQGEEVTVHQTRSINRGGNWETPRQVTARQDCYFDIALAESAGKVFIVWRDRRTQDWDLYMQRSSDGGASWSNDIALTKNPSMSHLASLAAVGDTLHLTWADDRLIADHFEVYYKRSTDGGVTWGADRQMTSTPFANYPKIVADGPSVHIAYTFLEYGTNDEIGYLRSTDAGQTWEEPVRQTRALSHSAAPSISVAGERLVIAWADFRDNRKGDIYWMFSTDGGAGWSSDRALVSSVAGAWAPTIAMDRNSIHLLWSAPQEGTQQVFTLSNPTGTLSTEPGRTFLSPKSVALGQNFPNPFNPGTTIPYTLSVHMEIRLSVHDMLGRCIAVLKDGPAAPGEHVLDFDGSRLPSGCYQIVLETTEGRLARPMTLMK